MIAVAGFGSAGDGGLCRRALRLQLLGDGLLHGLDQGVELRLRERLRLGRRRRLGKAGHTMPSNKIMALPLSEPPPCTSPSAAPRTGLSRLAGPTRQCPWPENLSRPAMP